MKEKLRDKLLFQIGVWGWGGVTNSVGVRRTPDSCRETLPSSLTVETIKILDLTILYYIHYYNFLLK